MILAVTATFAGGSPIIAGSVEVRLGGLFNFLRITALSIVLLGLGALVSWTTNVAEIAPAIATLGRPLRAAGPDRRLGGRGGAGAARLPMLIDEFRVLHAARRLRPKAASATRRGRHRLADVDLLAATITMALRRADEMGDAITARRPVRSLRRPPSRNGVTGWHFRWSPSSAAASRSRWNSRCWEPANRDSADESMPTSSGRDINSPTRR